MANSSDANTYKASTLGLSTLSKTDVKTAMTEQGYTAARSTKLDNLNAAVSTRLSEGDYVAPDNDKIASINTISGKLDLMIEKEGDDYRFKEFTLGLAPGYLRKHCFG